VHVHHKEAAEDAHAATGAAATLPSSRCLADVPGGWKRDTAKIAITVTTAAAATA
jgi:hypothetical protein